MQEDKAVYEDGWNLRNIKKLSLISRTFLAIKEKRFVHSLGSALGNFFNRYEVSLSHRLFTFKIDGHSYRYFTNRYNAINSERTVEIPWIMSKIQYCNKMLEIGNVLSHYYDFDHTVVDKYERSQKVINQDAENFDSCDKYDCIISISTIEHIGFDEAIKDNDKVKRTLKHLKDLLKDRGRLIITVPLGYNPVIDDIVKNNLFGFNEAIFMKRISTLNLWKQTKIEEALELKYNSRFPYANAVAFLEFRKT